MALYKDDNDASDLKIFPSVDGSRPTSASLAKRELRKKKARDGHHKHKERARQGLIQETDRPGAAAQPRTITVQAAEPTKVKEKEPSISSDSEPEERPPPEKPVPVFADNKKSPKKEKKRMPGPAIVDEPKASASPSKARAKEQQGVEDMLKERERAKEAEAKEKQRKALEARRTDSERAMEKKGIASTVYDPVKERERDEPAPRDRSERERTYSPPPREREREENYDREKGKLPERDTPLATPMLKPTDIKNFVFRPGMKGQMTKCKIQRMNKGMDRLYPTYYCYLEDTNQFLLAARKRKRSKSSNYLISTDQADLSREGDNFVGKVRSNFVGTEFLVYDSGVAPRLQENKDVMIRRELGAVTYGANVLGLQGPRKMQVFIPALDGNDEMIDSQPTIPSKGIISKAKAKSNNVLGLINKPPVWNEETQSYVLNFHKRVKLASVKNFQVVHPDNTDYIIMQFGRVTEYVFTMDFQYPMSLLQAFGIAISSFDSKLACE